ncbi:glycosyl hydrolase [Maribellus sediminis]|uniref:glycosyl hydrolase n=1 Tax=Maribellus sediminis TaxID=2696285 RepID=UPI0014309023|nr:glycosyl hydrolase [Maribellus sediminis]
MKIDTLIVLSLILLLASCSGNSKEDIKEPPVFNSSIPANNDENVSIATQIEVSFNDEIHLIEKHGITVNTNTEDIVESGTKILIKVVLEKDKVYVVSIPKGSVENNEGVPLAESIQFTFSTETAIPADTNQILVTANPSTEAVNVYNFLRENYGKKIISGAMANVSWNINEAEWVRNHTGKYPAMANFDYIFLNYSPANWIDYSSTEVVENWWNNNGLVSACWHWNVPKSEGSSEYAFYTSETPFQAANTTVDGTWENKVVKADLEEIAEYLKLLKTKNIPVIWRPLHEAAGNIYEYQNGSAWFWWGNGGAEAYKKLWIYMFEYFREQGLNNLIWVWTTQTKDSDFYPGDEYVDIIGRDIYNNTDAASNAEQYNSIRQEYPAKLVALSEMGSVATISAQWTAGAKWSFFMPWYDYDRTNNTESTAFSQTNHQHSNADWWKDAIENKQVITRDKMPSLK